MTGLRAIGAAAAAAIALAGCATSSNGPSDIQDVAYGAGPELYRQQMRDLDTYSDMTDDSLDDIAEAGCDLIRVAKEGGLTNAEALDALVDATRAFSTDAEALAAAVTIVGNHCPIDLTQ